MRNMWLMRVVKISWFLFIAFFFLINSTQAFCDFPGYRFDYNDYYNLNNYKISYINFSSPNFSSLIWNSPTKTYNFSMPQESNQIVFWDWSIKQEWKFPSFLKNDYTFGNLYSNYAWIQPYYFGYYSPFLKINNTPKKNPTVQADMDYESSLSSIQERLKRESDFDNWPCQNGPIRAGIILKKAHFNSFEEAEVVHEPNSHIMDDEDILGTEYRYRWNVEGRGKVDIRVIVTQTCLQAQDFLIIRYSICSMPPEMIHLGPRGEEYDIHAGDVSFVSGMDFDRGSNTKIRFVRNNIYVEITAYNEMRKEIKSIAEDLDHVLLSRPTGEEAIKLKPVIKKFWASKDTIQPNEKNYLTLEIESPTSDPVIWTPPEIVCLPSGGCSYPDGEVIVQWRTTHGYVGRDDGYVLLDEKYKDFYYRSEVESLHTITLLVSDSTGLISMEQIKIKVTD